jgi:hypothetical protein
MRRIATIFLGSVISFCGAVRGQDETGFVDHLNAARAQRGLSPVTHDPGLVPIASQNNGWQRQRGLGHWITGGFAQCAAISFSSVESVFLAWTRSASHAAIIYSPYAARVGFHCDGWAATVSVAMGTPTTLGVSPQSGGRNGTGRQPAAQNNVTGSTYSIKPDGKTVYSTPQATPAQPTVGTTPVTCAGGCSTTSAPFVASVTRANTRGFRGRRCGFRIRLFRRNCR